MKAVSGQVRRLAAAAAIACVSLASIAATGADAVRAETRARAADTAPDFVLAPPRGLVGDFGGFGSQLNQHVYANISGPPPNLPELERKVLEARPQLVRIFFNTTAWSFPDRLASFGRTVALAHRSGARVNVTWQGSGVPFALANMDRFAAVIADQLERTGMGAIWVTLFNEPNSTRITLAQYEAVYRRLDAHLRERGVRERVHFMGGDLLGTTSPLGQTQVDWFRYLAAEMGDLLDAWSVHVYWDFWDAGKIDRRLAAEVRAIFAAIPEGQRRPLYVTEFGVRGVPTFEGESGAQPGLWPDGTPMSETTMSAFQHAWFMLRASQLGFSGTVKWDLYQARYDAGTQDHSAIGPGSEGWQLRPVYHLLQLFSLVTEPRGGRIVELVARPGVEPTKLVSAYLSPGGNITVLGLDTRGGLVTTTLFDRVEHAIGGLPPGSRLRLLVWNGLGDGRTTEVGYLATDASGVARFSTPLHAVFALTSTAVELPR